MTEEEAAESTCVSDARIAWRTGDDLLGMVTPNSARPPSKVDDRYYLSSITIIQQTTARTVRQVPCLPATTGEAEGYSDFFAYGFLFERGVSMGS